jgi:hypothetical protein
MLGFTSVERSAGSIACAEHYFRRLEDAHSGEASHSEVLPDLEPDIMPRASASNASPTMRGNRPELRISPARASSFILIKPVHTT